MNQWWVNQNQTYAHEVPGGYLWSPKTNSNGGSNRFYDAMTETQPGDVVLSFCDTWIRAVGVVTGPCQSAPKPTEFGSAGGNWNHEGWFVPVQFTELKDPIRPREHMDVLGPTLPAKYSPLQLNGNGNQGVYLAPLPHTMAVALNRLLNGQVEIVIAGAVPDIDLEGDREQQRVVNDTTIPTTEREQLIKARVGQGLFRSRVELLEPMCRLTGLSDRRFLRASHIKPWSKSTDSEKLDGANGLLLAPHVDHLFDKGFISFDDDGQLRISPHLPPAVAVAWSIVQPKEVVPLTPAQAGYMAYHRESILLGGKEQGLVP
jgi:putative restriction endonuclease